MAQITAQMVRELREITGAGMMDCKKALTESSDMETAINFLREKGLAAAAKKAGRVASEGLVSIFADKKSIGMVELNCETDFVARGTEFNQLASSLAKHVTEGGLSDSLSGKVLPGNDLLKQKFCDDSAITIEEMINAKIALIGEKIDLRRSVLFAGGDFYGSYVHSGGSIGAVAELTGKDVAKDKQAIVEDLARDIAMHVAATAPLALTKDGVDPEIVANEKSIFTNQVLEQKKPANIVEKIV
ncbi:MAG: translation elongation factor Ts, partial [bacterium]|nr:translation elongation factor Ts [bacterium]